MPLSKLEYTDNIEITKKSLLSFFQELHVAMVKIINTDLSSCKSRASMVSQYCVADGKNNRGFIVLYIQILPGRTKQQQDDLQHIASQLLKKLLQSLGCKVEVQIRILLREANMDLYHMTEYFPL